MFSACVIHGYQNGSKFGFPTANLQFQDMPEIEKGVYAVRVFITEGLFTGMLYVGTRPTLKLNELSIEIHILGFHGNLYGRKLAFTILSKIRDEKKFQDAAELVEQLKRDRLAVERLAVETEQDVVG
ncbi:MAG: riboflavin kinase [Bacteroidales bacterium]|nr:riboflavin kinase [Bacteroidales bacterium]